MLDSLVPFVLIVHTLIAAGLVVVVLLQRSEGGALGIGQSTGGLVSARGADLLTRTTSLLGAAFVGTSLLLAILYGQQNQTRRIDADAAGRAAPAAPAPAAPLLPGTPIPGTPGAPAAGGVPLFPTAPVAPAVDPAAGAPAAAPAADPALPPGAAPAQPAQTTPAQPAPAQ